MEREPGGNSAGSNLCLRNSVVPDRRSIRTLAGNSRTLLLVDFNQSWLSDTHTDCLGPANFVLGIEFPGIEVQTFMTHSPPLQTNQNLPAPIRMVPSVAALLLAALLCTSTGCSLFVMGGKALFGDPKVTAPFTAATGEKLTEIDEAIVIICDAPHQVTEGFPSVQIDILDRVSRDLETQGINVVPSGDVARWFDDHGEWGDYTELAAEFDATYVMHVQMRSINHRVPESENLMQGQAEGHISVYKVNRDNRKNRLTGKSEAKAAYSVPVSSVFDRGFSVQFPTSYPVPREARSEEQFIQSFLDRVGLHISQHMYDYKMGDSIH